MTSRMRPFMVDADARLLDGVRAINRGGHGIAFVCDKRGRVMGTLTDGDVRRAILDGATLESRCLRRAMYRRFSYARPSEPRADVLDMMHARDINQVPVLDARRRLVGIHSLRELLGVVERENWAILMAGGQGTRLRPLTETVPKPMLAVAGRPILERVLLHLVGWGMRRVAISVNYLSHVIERHFGDGSRFGCQIRYLRERRPLGTGGALSLFRPIPRLPVIVMNGDLVTQVNVDQLLAFHAAGRFAVTVGVRPYSHQIPFGVVEVDGDRIVGLAEKPTQQSLVSAGLYVVSPVAMRLVPRGREFPITELFQMCLRKGLKVGARVVEDDWMDVGRHDDLRKAREGT